jgi:uncharacterized membrane protein YbhN (UPF0104 family)
MYKDPVLELIMTVGLSFSMLTLCLLFIAYFFLSFYGVFFLIKLICRWVGSGYRTVLIRLPKLFRVQPSAPNKKEGWLSGRKQLIANESGANTVPEVRILYPPPSK